MRILSTNQSYLINNLKQTFNAKVSSGIIQEKSLIDTKDENIDKLELSADAVEHSKSLNVGGITLQKVPRTSTIAIETLDSCINHINESLSKADSLNLSFNDRLEFLKNEGEKWVENIRQNDPEMFAQWLKMNKDNIQKGQANLANLPSNFTMNDYYSYVKEPFSALA